MTYPSRQTVRRGSFEIDPHGIRHQQDLVTFYEEFLSTFSNEISPNTDKDITRYDALQHAAARMALHSCQVVTIWEYLRSAHYLQDVTIEDFIRTVWPAYDTDRGAWFRAPLTREIKKNYGVPIISAGVKWLRGIMTQADESLMIGAGYCNDASDIEIYKIRLHGKGIAEIISEIPAVITINNTVGSNGPHAVLAWDIADNLFEYLSVDNRDMPLQSGFCRTSLDVLTSETAQNGAVTIVVPR